MAVHHPDQFLLTDYSAGNVPEAFALPIAVHMTYCPQCRNHVSELNGLGAELFGQLDPVPMQESALDAIMQRIDAGDTGAAGHADTAVTSTAATSTTRRDSDDEIPGILAKLLPNGFEQLSWRRMTRSLSVSHLPFGDREREVSLHHIKAGGRAPHHTHRGNEVTVVLKGSFSDSEGVYQQGDFIMRTPDDAHRPMAAADEDCICLSVLDAPIRLDGPISRLLNPFLKLHPQ